MPGYLQIVTRATVTAGEPFDCAVKATAASPGDVITVRLAQTAGLQPPYSNRAQLLIATDGTGMHIFQVTLVGPCDARLVADDLTSAIPLVADDAHLTVVP